jgi:hypothetical protein
MESMGSGEYILQGVSVYSNGGDMRVFFGNDAGNLYALDKGMCGDVTGDGKVRGSDGIRIFHHLTYGVPIDNMWAADVTGDDKVRGSDGIRIFHHLTYGVPLNCKCSG